jgi:hypothetical protein
MNSQQQPSGARWEYRTLEMPYGVGEDVVSTLNAAGAEGWEAIRHAHRSGG